MPDSEHVQLLDTTSSEDYITTSASLLWQQQLWQLLWLPLRRILYHLQLHCGVLVNGFTCGTLRRRRSIDLPGEREREKEKEQRALSAFMLGIGHGKGEGSTYMYNMATYVTGLGVRDWAGGRYTGCKINCVVSKSQQRDECETKCSSFRGWLGGRN